LITHNIKAGAVGASGIKLNCIRSEEDRVAQEAR
jgi:hypothetical protein